MTANTLTSTHTGCKTPGMLQGLLFVGINALLQTMLVTLISPILPNILEAFAGQPNAEFLATFSVTSPSLCMALCSPFVGGLIDRFGRRKPLLISLIVYAVVGALPYLITENLSLFIAMRLLLGVATSVIVTSAVTMLGDFFDGKEREHFLEINAAFAAIVAVACMAIGGILGSMGWQIPFLSYLIAIPFFFAVLLFTWEPEVHHAHTVTHTKEHFNWWPVFMLCLVVLAGGIAFITPLIFVGVIVSAIGYDSPSVAGMVGAGVSFAVPVGAIAFQYLRKRGYSVPGLVTLAFLFTGLGMGMMSIWDTLAGCIIGFSLQQFGSGFILAGMMIWMQNILPQSQRGKGTGFYFTSFMIAQPIAGFLFDLVHKSIGYSVLNTLGLFGAFSLIVMALLIVIGLPKGFFRKESECVA